jgi:hypothetical protein
VKRSLFDPLPRQISTKALVALVALVVFGTGISVARFLESSRTPIERAPAEVRAAPAVEPAIEGTRPQRIDRPSTRDARYSSGTSSPNGTTYTDGFGRNSALGRLQRAPSCSTSIEVEEPALARPTVEGS